jgi:tetratricopeptide (TPR) repeat protein
VTRWLVALAFAVLMVIAGYVVFLNPEPVTVHLTPTRIATWPLAGVLLGSFALGAFLVGGIALTRASSRRWRRWQAERRARGVARQHAVTARARELVWAGDYEKARAELIRSEGGVPSDATRLSLLAESHLQEGNPAEARALLEDGLLRTGLEPHLLALLAEAAERTGDLRGAADALERARGAQPESPRLARRLRDVYVAAGRWPEAVALQGQILLSARNAATLPAEEAIMRGLRYQATLGEPDTNRAARLLLALAREDPGFVPAWVSAGDRFDAAGRRFAARRAWERGARHQPAAVLLERLEQFHEREHKPERTTRFFKRLARRHPEAPAIPLLLARLLIARDALDEAEEVLAALPAPIAGLPLVHVLWGEIHRRRGNHTLAADTYARAFGTELDVLSPFRCSFCRHPTDAWEGYCVVCRHWGTLQARAERGASD